MNNKITKYFGTVFIGLLIVIFFSFVAELELLFRTEKEITNRQLNTANLSKFCTIEELERKLAQNPDDYFLTIRLAQMYEAINKLDKANDFYKSALALSGRSNFALYSYAIFCAKNNMYVFAATLAEELEGNSSKVNLFKAKIYEQIADNLDKQKNYPASVKSYQIVYKYAKSIGDLKFLNSIKEKYSQEYIKLADYHMSQDDVAQAIVDLKNSLEIKESPLANYKLGLIYLNTELALAEKHINKAFFKDPYVVNPYIYNQVLTSLLEHAQKAKSGSLTNYYNSRLNRFKKLLKTSYLYKTDVSIENSALITKKSFLKKDKHYLFFEIKNNTKENLENLYVKTELYVNGNKHVIQKKIITPTRPIEPYESIKSLDIELPKDVQFNNLKQNNDIFVRYYAKKKEEAPWVLLNIDFLNI